MHREFWWGNLKERSHFEDPEIDGRIIDNRDLQEVDGVAGIVFVSR
jgi:hypothetical protein